MQHSEILARKNRALEASSRAARVVASDHVTTGQSRSSDGRGVVYGSGVGCAVSGVARHPITEGSWNNCKPSWPLLCVTSSWLRSPVCTVACAHTHSLSLTAHLFASLPFVYLLVPSAIVSLVLWDVVWAST